MIVMFNRYEVYPDDMNAYNAWVIDLASKFKRDEPGCLGYEIMTHPLDPQRRAQFEVFSSLEAFDAHMANPDHDTIRYDHKQWGLRSVPRTRVFEATEMPVEYLRSRVEGKIAGEYD